MCRIAEKAIGLRRPSGASASEALNELKRVEPETVATFYAMADAALIAAAPELAVALRKVTARLRAAYDNAPAECVLEAEALLKRINEGGG